MTVFSRREGDQVGQVGQVGRAGQPRVVSGGGTRDYIVVPVPPLPHPVSPGLTSSPSPTCSPAYVLTLQALRKGSDRRNFYATTPERFSLTLQALPDPDGVPAIIRLRRVLKYALRVCRLRCVAIEPADGPRDLEQ